VRSSRRLTAAAPRKSGLFFLHASLASSVICFVAEPRPKFMTRQQYARPANKMLQFNRLTAVLAVALLLSPAPGEARTRKGDKLLAEGRYAEQTGDFEKALGLYEQALKEDPTDIAYQLSTWRVRFQASQARVDQGQKLRSQGKLQEALAEFQRAYALNPSSLIAEQELRRTYQMIEREKKKAEPAAPGGKTPEEAAEERAMTPYEVARKESEDRVASLQPVPELRPISRQIHSLKMNNQPVKVLFETVGKLAGINVVFDPEYQATAGRNFSVDLTNTTLEEALEHIATITKSYWKPLSANTIFVTNDNVTKLRDYQDHVVKVFYLRNVGTVQELNEIATVVRSLTDIRRLFPYNAQNALVARGSVDQIALAEKLIQDLDKPRSEVVIDVIVMEANRGRTRDLAAAIASGGKAGFRESIGFTGGTPASSGTDGNNGSSGDGGTAGGLVKLGQLGKLTENDWSITLPGAILAAVMDDRLTKVRQSPQVRAVANAKASLRIGDRVPTATGSFQPGIGTIGVSPLVNTQFQFIEVGVNVDIVPQVHGPDEVSLHIELEISNVRDRIDIGGIQQPIIGQRKVVHDIRIREGEVSLLGGLMQDQDSKVVTGIPGLGQIPVIKRLFTSESIDRSRSELLIALIPHIVRSPEITDVNLRGVSAGNDQTVKLNYAPRPVREETPAVPAPTTPAVTTPAAPAPPATPETKPPAEAKPPAPAGPVVFRFVPPAAEVRLSGALNATLQAENVTDLFAAPMRIKFDPKLLRLVSVKPGTLMSGDGQNVNFSENTLNDVGEATITLNRLPGSTGVSGSGSLLVLSFQAVGQGATTVQVTDLNMRNSQLQPIAAPAPAINITVR
jgi:general secretion pathway protein D